MRVTHPTSQSQSHPSPDPPLPPPTLTPTQSRQWVAWRAFPLPWARADRRRGSIYVRRRLPRTGEVGGGRRLLGGRQRPEPDRAGQRRAAKAARTANRQAWEEGLIGAAGWGAEGACLWSIAV
jgi:hypothetical protein